jgi:hypothetical protein
MDLVYHVSEVTFLILTSALVGWIALQPISQERQTARAPVYVKEDEPRQR